jgi:8-oxo-dGTP diphosphatase
MIMMIVTCAVIRNEEGEVLVVQRGEATDHPFKWEFPGGKLAPGETEEECIIREVEEELSMDIIICGKLPFVEHDYGIKQIRLIPFICDTLDEIPFLSEHIAYKWLNLKDLSSMDFSEADVFVANSYFENFLSEGKMTEQKPEEIPVINDAELQGMINKMIGMKEAEWMATSAVENQAIFMKLIEYSYSPDKRLGFRASWILSKACDKYPGLIHPYLGQIVDNLEKLTNESAIRSFLRILSFSDLDVMKSNHHGILADYCFRSLNSGFSAIAVKAYSMEILYNLTMIYPDLGGELATTIISLMENGPAGIRARGRMILNKLADNSIRPISNQQ